MLIKICGMRDGANISQIAQYKPDLMGFIFYPKSKRYVGEDFDVNLVYSVMPEIQTVGVFVNEDNNKLLELAQKYRLDYIQLHGNESPQYCQEIINSGYKVLKAFGINPEFDFAFLEQYMEVCQYFLFDTNSNGYGGSGQKFDWQLLHNYTLNKPFLLSGGIIPEDTHKISVINHEQFAGIDINSGFEVKPGLKDPEKIQEFLNQIRTR